MSSTSQRLNIAIPSSTGAATLDLSANATSMPVKLEIEEGCSIQAIITGTAVGTAKIQVSDDPPTATPTNWQDYPMSSASITGAGTARWVFDGDSVEFEWLRVVYTRSSNNGTMALRMTAKGT